MIMDKAKEQLMPRLNLKETLPSVRAEKHANNSASKNLRRK